MDINKLKSDIADLQDDNDALIALEEPTKDDMDTIDKNLALIEELETKIKTAERVAAQAAKRKDIPTSFEVQGTSNDERKLYESYSIVDHIRKVHEGTNVTLDGAEAEVQAEAKRESNGNQGSTPGSIMIPSKLFKFGKKGEKRDLTIATEGADVEFDQNGGVIPILRAMPVMTSLGAQTFQGLQGDLRFPRHNAAATMAWEGETDAGAETTPTFNNVTLTPKRLGGYTQVSGQFLRQSVFNATQWVSNELSTALSLALDSASISGATGGDNPVGLAYISSVNDPTRASATNGKALSWADVVNMRKEVAKDNGADGAYLLNPDVKASLQTTARVASTDSRFILDIDGQLAGYPFAESTQVPNTLTKGSGTALSAIFYGQFSEAMFGQWGAIELLVDPYSSAKSGLIDIVINGYFDFNVRHPESFSRYIDVIT